jgi:hypothetical protein
VSIKKNKKCLHDFYPIGRRRLSTVARERDGSGFITFFFQSDAGVFGTNGLPTPSVHQHVFDW